MTGPFDSPFEVVTGNTGGFTAALQLTPVVQAAAYTAGQAIGGLLSLAGASRFAGGTGMVQFLAATFASGVQPSLDVVFFNAAPINSTLGDRTTIAVATADLGKVIGVAHLTDVTLLGASAPSLIQATQQAMPFGLAAATTLYAVVVTRTAITLGAVNDMTLTVSVLQD